MSASKLKNDLKLLEQQLTEIETNISDPIERNEQKKQLEREIKKLKRSLERIEVFTKEQQELESIKTEYLSSDRKKDISNLSDDLDTQVNELNLVETPSNLIFSEPNPTLTRSEISNNSDREKFKSKYFIILGITFIGAIATILIINFISNQKAEQARLQELARQQITLARQEAEQAKRQQAEAEQEKQKAILAQEKA